MSRVEGFEGLASECGWFRVEAHGQLQVFDRESPNSGREPRTIAGVQRSRSSEARFCPSLLVAQGCGAAYAWAARGWLELTCMGPWCKALCQESRHESSYLEAGGKMQRHSTALAYALQFPPSTLRERQTFPLRPKVPLCSGSQSSPAVSTPSGRAGGINESLQPPGDHLGPRGCQSSLP